MSKFLDWDPIRGLEQYEDAYEGRQQLHYRQDVEPVLELAKTERINGLADTKQFKQQDLRLYARIPPVVILKLKYEHGVDIYNKDHLKKVFQLINEQYPILKCTDMKHDLRGKG